MLGSIFFSKQGELEDIYIHTYMQYIQYILGLNSTTDAYWRGRRIQKRKRPIRISVSALLFHAHLRPWHISCCAEEEEGGGTGRHCFPSSSELKRRPGYGSYWLWWYSNFFRLSTHERVHTHMKPYGKHLSLISTKIRAPPNTAIKVPPPIIPLCCM